MGRTLYVTDLDGTLLNTHDRISPYSTRTINRLVEEGMLFTYATARSLVSASVVAKGLSTNIPVIVYNGAFIINPATGEMLSELYFQAEEIQKVRGLLMERQINPLVYAYVYGVEKLSWVTGTECEGCRHYLSRRPEDPRKRPLRDDRELYDGKVFYFTCIGEKEELQPVYDLLSRDGRFRCTLQRELYRPEFWLEIMPAKASKAEAVRALKKLWNCDRVVSFGDAVNDIPLFEESDECYAVANGVEELKARATGVIGSNEEDGVARWLAGHAEKYA
ncbi:5-amino-6-(5-phospho-D-ribitylamino)uracil phosphatase YwtE [Lachnospiraceae bacterium]|jgi:Cof subfamily protein (haloacid dehalogenase superfamily)|nr:HAD family hydrolase [Lachnospiraceae bacterium]MCX4304681.1 HAD family hydrolase [Acetatifactor sp.]GFI65177.1 5-amino-6-(5-phospho-D-ribitylamino)uracil phosphatase YwtE [Lachnospiraceae bacterium]